MCFIAIPPLSSLHFLFALFSPLPKAPYIVFAGLPEGKTVGKSFVILLLHDTAKEKNYCSRVSKVTTLFVRVGRRLKYSPKSTPITVAKS